MSAKNGKTIRETMATINASKPENVDQAALDAQAAKTREGLKDSAINVPNPEAAKTEAHVPTELESMLHRLGFKSALQTKTENVISVNKVSSDALEELEIKVKRIGVDPNASTKVYLLIDPDRVKALYDAKQTTRTARTSGEKFYSEVKVYRLKSQAVNSVNPVKSGTDDSEAANMTIEMESGIRLNVYEVKPEFFGKTPAGNDKKADSRNMPFVVVKHADGKTEVINSYWIQGLMKAVSAHKTVIVSDGFNGDLESYRVKPQ